MGTHETSTRVRLSVIGMRSTTTSVRQQWDAKFARGEDGDGRDRGISRVHRKDRTFGAISRLCRLAVVGRAARRARVSRALSGGDAAARRAHQHQSGGGRVRRVRSVAREFPDGPRQSECPPRIHQHADRLRGRHAAGGDDRSHLFVDRRAHQYAVQALHRRREPAAVVRAAAGRRGRLVDPRLAEVRARSTP